MTTPTTQELIEVVTCQAVGADIGNLPHLAANLRAAASRISELQDEVVRMREALAETHLDLAVYTDIEVARKRLVERRAALDQQGDRG